MIIGIDGNEANVEKKVGVSEFAYELLRVFATTKVPGTQFIVYLKHPPRTDLPEKNDQFYYKVFGPSRLWTQIALPFHLFTQKPVPDVFFTPSHYVPRFCPSPLVMSIMDLSYVYFPNLFRKTDLYQLRNWTSYSVRRASKILTISNASKDDIITEYKVPEEKVVVVYPGIKESIQKPHIYMNAVKTKYTIGKKYILFVGTLQPRKNILRLIEAFSMIVSEKEYEDIQLIIVGKKGWLYEEILEAPSKFKVETIVKFLDYVSNEDLTLFYQNAICFVLPSLYEGFGLPVLEAMKNSCPVITSNVSSLPEVGGDAALYINPEDVNDIADKIKKVIDNPSLQKEMIEKGKNQVKKFSWEKTAGATLKVLQEVATKKNER